MNADFDTELLSALLDGELSPADADAVRQRIAESDSLAAELANLESLSKAVRQVPAVPAPASLHGNVVGALGAVPESVSATSTVSPPPLLKRGWTGVAGGLIAAIALCVVVVVSNRDGAPNNDFDVADNRRPGAADSASVDSDSAIAMTEKVAGGAPAEVAAPASAVASGAPASPENSALREPEAIADTGLIQRSVELVQVFSKPDELHQQLMSARLTPRESSDAPEGYRAFVVEGSRSEINRVLKEYQRITRDRSIQIDRTSVPKPILAEFKMEIALVGLDDRGAAMDSAVGASKMRQAIAPPAGEKAASRRGSIPSPSRQARNRDSVPGIRESVKESRGAQAKPEALPQSKDGTILVKRVDTKVLFLYKLPTESKEPCAGA